MKNIHILFLPILLLLVSCGQDTPTSVSPSGDELTEITLAKNSNIDAFDMVDAFSGSGAKGNGFVKVEGGGGGVMDLTIHAGFLEADHNYEVHVTVGVKDADCGTFAVDNFHVFPVTSDKNGKFNFKELGFDLVLASGQYRLDYLVVDPLDAPFALDGSDFLLACLPASCVIIE